MAHRNPRVRRLLGGGAAAAVLAGTIGFTGMEAAPAAAEVIPEDCSAVPWMDTSLSADERAQAVLDASTLEQTMRWVVEHPATQPDNTVFAGVEYPEALPCLPDIQFSDGPEGVHRADGVTGFPSPLAEASIWDEDLTERKYDAISTEAWENRRTVLLAPGFAAHRTPLAARTTSYFSEDPVLSGVLGASAVRSLQAQDGTPTLATLKHWVGNEQRTGEEEGSSNMDDRTMRQLYNLPYEIAIKEGEPNSIMCSYNMINNIYACEHPLQKSLLKEDNGFEGFIMSDFGGVYSTVPSFLGGMDMELNRPVYYTPENLHAALDAGEITEDQLDEAAFRVIRGFVAAGLFDVPRAAEANPNSSTPEHKDIAQEIAEKGSVLLKNDGVLPISGDGPTVAVIGETAANTASSVCTPFGQIRCPSPVTPLEAIEDRLAEDGGQVLYDDGTDLTLAAAAADEADLVVVFGYETTGYGEDRENLNLDGNSDALIEELASVHDNVVVVLQVGTAVEMPWIDDVEGVLNTWYAGERMGTAIAGLLFGDVNPSGKLPVTFPVSVDDTPTGGWDERVEQFPGVEDENGILQTDYTEGLEVGYRWYEAQGIEPLFEFGHGLSYTTFEYSDLSVTRSGEAGSQDLDVSFTVANTGDVAGDEIAQVYIELPEAADEPSKRLIAWDRVEGLEPGQTEQVSVTLSADQLDSRHLLDHWDMDQDAWVTWDEDFTIHVGSSVQDVPLSQTYPESTEPAGPSFTDVAESNLFFEEIEWLAEQGISTGWEMEDGTAEFRPLEDIARDAMAAFLYRMADEPEFTPPAESPFTDVSTSNQFYTEIAWLAQEGISTGWVAADGSAEFRPLEPINRDAMAAFLFRYADVEDYQAPAVSAFEDVAPSTMYYEEISWLAESGISTGWQGNNGTALYRPLTPIARDAMAAFLYRFDQMG